MNEYFTERNQKNILDLRELLKELPDFCSEYFLGIAPRTAPLTRVNYAHDLKTFFGFLSERKFYGIPMKKFSLEMLDKVSVTDLEQYLDYLTLFRDTEGKVHQNNEKAKARLLSSVRSLFRYFFNKSKLTANIASKMEMPKLHSKEIIRLETNEVVDLLDEAETGRNLSPRQAAYHNKTAVRDLAILTLFLGTGIRISELVGLNLDDLNFDTNAFRVTRKGGNQVVLYFGDEVADALKIWIAERNKNEKLNGENALFISTQNQRIGVRAVENMVKKYASVATPLKKITPHKLRSTYGTNLYRETKDIYVVAEVLGHKDVNTTKKHYAAISEDIRRSVAGKVALREDKEE